MFQIIVKNLIFLLFYCLQYNYFLFIFFFFNQYYLDNVNMIIKLAIL